MKFSPLALVLFASTTLVSVTSAADTGGVRGSIDQTQSRRSLGVYMGFTDFAENANSPASLQAQKDWFRHQYIEEDWEDLPLKVQNAAKLLGFTERSWNAEDDSEKLNTHIYDSDESNGDFHGDKPSDDSEKLKSDEVCSDCAGCWMSNAFWLPEKCQTQNFFNKEVDLTKADCYNMKNVGLAYGWCAAGIDRAATLSYATKNAATLGYYKDNKTTNKSRAKEQAKEHPDLYYLPTAEVADLCKECQYHYGEEESYPTAEVADLCKECQ